MTGFVLCVVLDTWDFVVPLKVGYILADRNKQIGTKNHVGRLRTVVMVAQIGIRQNLDILCDPCGLTLCLCGSQDLFHDVSLGLRDFGLGSIV